MVVARIELTVVPEYTHIRYEVREADKPLYSKLVSFGNPDALQVVLENSKSLWEFIDHTPEEYYKHLNNVPPGSKFFAVFEYEKEFVAPKVVTMVYSVGGMKFELHKKFSNEAPAKIREMVINNIYKSLISLDFSGLANVIKALK